MRVRSAVAVLVAAFAGSALAQAQPTAPAEAPKPLTMEKSSVPGTVGGGQAEQVTAKVKAIDVEKRLLTLKGPKGHVETFEVGPEVKNLAQVKVGDLVVVNYWRGAVLEFLPPGTKAGPASAVVTGEAAAVGARPAATATATVQGTVKIKSIDERARTVTFVGEKGRTYTLNAGPTIDLSKAKVGMTFQATYKTGVAVAVEPAKKKAAK
jgi:hypothetical protein